MTHSSRTTAERAVSDARRLKAVRFLIHGGLLPSSLGEEFGRPLTFVVQARNLGLSIADFRQLRATGPSVSFGVPPAHSVGARTAVAS
jgi:hypothetical protein